MLGGAGCWPALVSVEHPESWFSGPSKPLLKPAPRVSGKAWPLTPALRPCPLELSSGSSAPSALPDAALPRGLVTQLLPLAGRVLTRLGAWRSAVKSPPPVWDSACFALQRALCSPGLRCSLTALFYERAQR